MHFLDTLIQSHSYSFVLQHKDNSNVTPFNKKIKQF